MEQPEWAKPIECYELARQLKVDTSVTTDDGWTLLYGGNLNNPLSQTITARKGDKETVLRHYRGSEGIARVLHLARTK